MQLIVEFPQHYFPLSQLTTLISHHHDSLLPLTVVPEDVDVEVLQVHRLPHVADAIELDVDGVVDEGVRLAVRHAVNDEAANTAHHLDLGAAHMNLDLKLLQCRKDQNSGLLSSHSLISAIRDSGVRTNLVQVTPL